MTPQEIITLSRQAYNAVGDTFWSDNELLSYIYLGSINFAQKALPIEGTFTLTTTNGTREYSYPTNLISIRRVTYDGEKLQPISLEEDDILTANNAETTDTGTPLYYSIWDSSIFLRPTPEEALTLKVYGYLKPQPVTINSTLEIPSLWHEALVDYVLWRMVIKDKNTDMTIFYKNNYESHVNEAKKWWAKRKRGDKMAMVKNVDSYPFNQPGALKW